MSRYNPSSCRCNPDGASEFPWGYVLAGLGGGAALVLGIQAITKKTTTTTTTQPPQTPQAPRPPAGDLRALAQAIQEVEQAPAGMPRYHRRRLAPAGSPPLAYRMQAPASGTSAPFMYQPASGVGEEDALDILMGK